MRFKDTIKKFYPDSPELYEETVNDPEDDGFVNLEDIVPKKNPKEVEEDIIKEAVDEYDNLPIEYTSGWKIFASVVIGILLGVVLVVAPIYFNLIPQFIPVAIHEDLLNESHDVGLYDMSQYILQNKLIPLYEDNGEEIYPTGDFKKIEVLG